MLRLVNVARFVHGGDGKSTRWPDEKLAPEFVTSYEKTRAEISHDER
jgi:hypothetical protein